MIAFIDGGTTNSRVFIYRDGKVISEGKRKVGVKDTAITGSRDALRQGIREAMDEAISRAGCCPDDIQCCITSGMITSELGLLEIPHVTAPASLDDLAESVVVQTDENLFPYRFPVVFIRGIKNRNHGQKNCITDLPQLDFMRGEEVQVFGILKMFQPKYPVNIIMFGSHTKLIHVDHQGAVSGCITTISGQFYEAITQGTFIGKSLLDDGKTSGQFTEHEILTAAESLVHEAGLLRAMMMPRFMQVLMDTAAVDRKLFVDAAIAAQDIRIIDAAKKQNMETETDYVLYGPKVICRMYERLLKKRFGDRNRITCITDPEAIRDITIAGSLEVVKKAGVIDGIC